MRHSTSVFTIAVMLAMASGCAVGETQQPVERSDQALWLWQPFFIMWSVDLVGRGLNGTSLNGEPLQDDMVVAVSLEDVDVGHGKAKDLTLSRTVFSKGKGKANKKGKPKKLKVDNSMIGAVFSANLQDGSDIRLRIEDMVLAGEDNDPFLKYSVSFETLEGWLPLCGTDDSGEPVLAIPLTGTWNYEKGTPGAGQWTDDSDQFTFACDGFVLAKCVAMGYKPWTEGQACDSEGDGTECFETDLRLHHQACTRALRADYCGDGESHTVENTMLNLYDNFYIRVDSEDWLTEAEWDADGARCVLTQRIDDLPLPACAQDMATADCGDESHFANGTLLMTEVAP